MAGPDYQYRQEDEFLLIVDLNQGGLSVTNGIEQVLLAIKAGFPRWDEIRHIIYRDSDGTWDGIDFDKDGDFIDFYPIGLELREAAMAAVRLRRKTQ
jgi:hypothetical protein